MKSLQIPLRSFLVLAAFATALLGQIKAVAADADENIGSLVGTVSVPEGLSKSDVQKAIVMALIGRKWDVKTKTDDRVVGYLKHRTNEATLTLIYDATKVDLYCVGWQIDKKTGAREKPEQPERWLRYIQNDLPKFFSRTLATK